MNLRETEEAKFAIQRLIENFELPEPAYESDIEEAGDDLDKLYVLGRKILKDGVFAMCKNYGFKVEKPFMPGDGIHINCSLLDVTGLLNKELQKRIRCIEFSGEMKPLLDFYFKFYSDYEIPYAGYIAFEQKETEE